MSKFSLEVKRNNPYLLSRWCYLVHEEGIGIHAFGFSTFKVLATIYGKFELWLANYHEKGWNKL